MERDDGNDEGGQSPGKHYRKHVDVLSFATPLPSLTEDTSNALSCSSPTDTHGLWSTAYDRSDLERRVCFL